MTKLTFTAPSCSNNYRNSVGEGLGDWVGNRLIDRERNRVVDRNGSVNIHGNGSVHIHVDGYRHVDRTGYVDVVRYRSIDIDRDWHWTVDRSWNIYRYRHVDLTRRAGHRYTHRNINRCGGDGDVVGDRVVDYYLDRNREGNIDMHRNCCLDIMVSYRPYYCLGNTLCLLRGRLQCSQLTK